MTPEQWVFAGATAALALAFAGGVPFPDRRTLTHPAILATGALFLVSLFARAMFVQPTLVHADVAAPELVDCVLQFPLPCTSRGASYGQYGFWTVGALSHLLGRDLTAVFRVMAIVGALNVALLAVLAYRLSGSPYGALIAVAITGTHPIFMRVAASEEMHNVGLLLGLLAFIAMDVFAVTRRTLALVAAVLALGLMMNTRQTFHVFVPCVFLLGLARGGRGLLRSRAYWAAGVIVLAVLLSRVLGNSSGSLADKMMGILGEPALVPTILRHHPLFDFSRFGLLPLLTMAAIGWACVAGGIARAVAVVFAANFIVTYPCGMSSPGVEFAQRIGVHAIGMVLVALAGAAILETLVAKPRRTAVGIATAIALAAMPPFLPGWRSLNVLTPIHREYLAVQAAAAELPGEFTQVVLPTSDSGSYGGSRYAGLLARMGKRVEAVLSEDLLGKPRPWIFLENIECWTYSFHELTGVGPEASKHHRFAHRWDYVIFGRQPSPLRPPAEARIQCRPFLRHSRPIGPGHVIADPADDPPFLFYGTNAVPIRFHELHEQIAQ